MDEQVSDKAKENDLTSHTGNSYIHVTTTDKETWNNKADQEDFDGHVNNTSNPHNVKKDQIGLGNVDNTSDINKPVSTAQQSALDNLKSELSEHIVSESNEWIVSDESGNIVAKIDENGLEATNITTDSIVLNSINLETELNGKASIYHASNNNDYGLGSNNVYGHVKLSDSTNSSLGINDGTAATPTAVKSAYERADSAYTLAESKISSLLDLDITATSDELNHICGVTSGIQAQLDNKASSVHDHDASEITSGTLSTDRLPTIPVSKGGTGIIKDPSVLVNLASTTAASVFAESPRIGVTGILPVANGGTGRNDATPIVYASSAPSSPVAGVIYAIPI